MIYTIGIESKKYTSSSVEECLEYFGKHGSIQFDCETTSLDCHTGKLKCFQVGDYFNQYVIHPKYLQDFKELLESKELVGQNLRFDIKWLYKNKIYPTKVWDTYLAEGVLFCGLKLHRKNLGAIAKRTLNLDLDKSVQDTIWEKEELSEDEIEYSGNDVKYLDLIRQKQESELLQKDLVLALEIENKFVLCLAYIEYCGFKLDRQKWLERAKNYKKEYDRSLEELNEYIIENNLTNYIKDIHDLFGSSRVVTIKWSSPKQVNTLFKELGINTSIVKKGVKKETTTATHIQKYAGDFPILPIYLKYKESEKVVSTYGYSFLEHINSATDRVHSNFTQIMSTARISSGGQDSVNFQNIPADKETRACFIAEEGNILIISDYAGQEQVILANQSMDPSLLEFYDSGMKDMHSYTASKVFPELEGVSVEEIKENHKDKRNVAKTVGFAINYGGVGVTIARNANISIEEGNRVYDAYFESFPGLKAYFDLTKQQGLRDGFILMSQLTHRKSYIHNYEEYLLLKQKFNAQYWEVYRAHKERAKQGIITDQYSLMKEEVSTFFKIKGDIERKALNFPIQSPAGEISKIACIKVFEFIQDNNLYDTVKFVNVIHDELVLECPIEMQETIKGVVEDSMVDAGKPYCQRVPLKADAFCSLFWKK